MTFFIDFKILRYSIVNIHERVDNKKDANEPYKLVEFIKNLDISDLSNEFVVDAYNNYLLEWSKIKNQVTESFEEIRKRKYIELLRNIQIDFLNQDEQRILGNIDYENPLEMEVAIPFFVEKIKDIIEYYIKKRRDVKNSKAKWSTKGSKEFLRGTISQHIIDNYTKNENTFQAYKQNYQELSLFQNQYRFEHDGLYDFNDYRKIEFSFDDSTFLSSGDDYNLEEFELTSFSDYTKSAETLILELKKRIYQRYISTDKQYFKNGQVTDVKSQTPFYDPYNYDKPFISRIPTEDNLLRDKDIGYYFTSKYIYSSNYYSPYGISVSDINKLSGLLPKLDVYRSEDYKDYFLWSKYSHVNQGLIGKPIVNQRLKRFYGYQSRDLNIDDSVGGVEKYTDKIQLWEGNKNEDWSNEDVFAKFNNNILNRQLKNDFFFNLNDNEGVYKYACDIYGNQYYLIKNIDLPFENINSVYNLRASVIDQSDGILVRSLLGQRVVFFETLRAIQIDTDLAVGFFVSSPDLELRMVDQIGDFNLIQTNYYNLISDIFNTLELSSTSESTLKSIYENQYTVGRVAVRDVNNKNVGDINKFIQTHNIQNIIDIDIVGDLIIFTTTDSILSAKIKYNFSNSVLTFEELYKNELTFYNKPLHKTSSYWYDNVDGYIYMADIDYKNSEIKILYINSKTNDRIEFVINDSNIDYDSKNIISFESMSKPQLIKDDNNLYIILLLKDVCDNYYYQVIKYNINDKNSITAIYNNIYHPSNLRLTRNILDDSLAQSSAELSSFVNSQPNFPNRLLYYWRNENGGISGTQLTYQLTYSPFVDSFYYDNDKNEIVNNSKPDKKYNLSDLIRGVSQTINETDTENLISYIGDFIYTPVEILLDFRNIDNFENYISRDEPIYKIEYYFNNEIKTQYILSFGETEFDNDIFSGEYALSALALTSTESADLSAVSVTDAYEKAIALNRVDGEQLIGIYNQTFESSPINMKYISFINKSSNFSIYFYSLSGKLFRFDFSFTPVNFALSQQYDKVELLDSRIKDTVDGKECILYLNTRNPNSVINTSLLLYDGEEQLVTPPLPPIPQPNP